MRLSLATAALCAAGAGAQVTDTTDWGTQMLGEVIFPSAAGVSPPASAWHHAASSEGCFFITGGSSNDGVASNASFRYDISTNAWAKLADLPVRGGGWWGGGVGGEGWGVYVCMWGGARACVWACVRGCVANEWGRRWRSARESGHDVRRGFDRRMYLPSPSLPSKSALLRRGAGREEANALHTSPPSLPSSLILSPSLPPPAPPSLPPAQAGYQAPGAVVNGGWLLLTGGANSFGASNQFLGLPVDNTATGWRSFSVPNAPSARNGHRLVSWGGILYMFGGCVASWRWWCGVAWA